jgi:hypothetical protein
VTVDLGTVRVTAGDGKTIRIVLQEMDYSSSTFRAQARKRAADDEKLVDFSVAKTLEGSNTVLTLHLTGDSAFGQRDGQTRKLGRAAECDVQETPASGDPYTSFKFKIKVDQDVTR